MNTFSKSALVFAMTISAVDATPNANAAERKMYGRSYPFTVTDLPANSPLRKRLNTLTPTARSRGLRWLSSFDFPASDTKHLNIDRNGGVFYVDSILPEPTAALTAGSPLPTPASDLANVFFLHSRPGASKVVFLDFDGHTISGTAWNLSSGVASYSAIPFDIDGNTADFNADERNRIAEVWHRIAEDFAPFDIDVTTQEPLTFGPEVGRVLFTRNTDLNGIAMPSNSAGGVAYVNVFGNPSYTTTYSPAFVYTNQLGPNNAAFMAEAGAHEFGHNLGLSHDGVLDGTKNTKCLGSTGYFCGLSSGYISWAPIMGVGYYTNVTEWSKGEYLSANNTQDDVSIIGSKLGYITDDVADTTTGATPLEIDASGIITSTTPENDPANIYPANKGSIGTRADIDMFAMDVGAGPINITVKPAWAAFTRTSNRGANLDIDIKLYNQAGFIVANDITNDTYATISRTVTAGRYYLAVSGVGNTSAPYSDYGSLGEYFISGSVTTLGGDITPPNPNPMTWAQAPVAQSKTRISMVASTATDASGYVEYQFLCITGGNGCVNSAWQTSPTYNAIGLTAGTTYDFAVKARDANGNMTEASNTVSVTTLANRAPVVANENLIIKEDSTTTISVLTNDKDPDGDVLSISSAGPASNGTVTISAGKIIYKPTLNFNGTDSFAYTVSDGFGGTAIGTVNLTITPVNDAPSAIADSITVVKNTTTTINVLDNDKDVDGDSLTLVSLTATYRGVATRVNNAVSYKAGAVTGREIFNYTVSDGKGGSRSTTITVNIVQ